MQESLRKSKQPILWDRGIIFLFAILFLCSVIYRYTHNVPSMLDFFKAYYPAGKSILEHPSALYELNDTIVFGFVNLPIIAYLFAPFVYLDESHAGILFTLLGIATTFLLAFTLISFIRLEGWKRLLFLGLILLNIPFSNSIWQGNTTHFVLLLVVCSFFCFRLKQKIWSGVLLAVAGLIKIPLLFPILYFALRGQWQVVKGFSTTLLATVGLSVLICGSDLNLIWFKKCILTFSGKAVAAYNAQSVDSFLIRLLTDARIDIWEATEESGLFKLLRYGLFLILIGGTLLTMMRPRHFKIVAIENLEFSSFLCLALLISPISWTHYYLVFLLPIALYLGGQLGIPDRWQWTAAMALSILLIITPPVKSVPFSNSVLAAFTRHFLVSHYFWGVSYFSVSYSLHVGDSA